MKKVLFIAFYFNQTNEIASKRLRGLAKYLSKFGWEPIVIVPKFENNSNSYFNNNNHSDNFVVFETDYEDMLDAWLKKINPFNNNNVTHEKVIGESVNKNVKSNINHEKVIGESVNKNVKLNVTHEKNSADEINSKDIEKKENTNNYKTNLTNKFFSKAISIAGELFAYPDGMKYWYKPAIEKSQEIFENEDIHGIISSSWPVTSHIIAKDLKIQFNVPWIADLRDLWNMNPYISHNFLRSYFEKKLEIETFKYADALTTTSELATKTLNNLHPNAKIFTVLSGFDRDYYNDANDSNNVYFEKNKKSEDFTNKLNFTYTGSLYGGKRDPELLFKAISQLINEKQIDSSKIMLDFYGDNGNLDEIAIKYDIRDILNIHGQIPQKDVLKKQKESQVLLLISWNDEKEKIFIPGKFYEYLAVKRPVFSIGYKEGSLKDLIEKTNVGWHVSSFDDVKKTFMKIYNDFIENNIVSYNGSSEVENYSMANTAKCFGKILDSLNNDY